MKRKGFERIIHIKECIEKILRATHSTTREDLENDEVLFAALVRWIEIIGEATKYVPDEIVSAFPQIPWKEMAGMRDIVVHDYDDVAIDEIWNVVQKDIPLLKAELDKITTT